MVKLLKKDTTYCWNDDHRKSLDVLKEKMASAPILVFPKWDVEFHVHVDASCIALGVVLTQEGVDHLIVFASWGMSKAEKTILLLSTKGWQWYMHSKNTNTIYLAGTSRCIPIIPC